MRNENRPWRMWRRYYGALGVSAKTAFGGFGAFIQMGGEMDDDVVIGEKRHIVRIKHVQIGAAREIFSVEESSEHVCRDNRCRR